MLKNVMLSLTLASLLFFTSCSKKEPSDCKIGQRTLLVDLESEPDMYEQILNLEPVMWWTDATRWQAQNYIIISDEFKDWVGHVRGGFGKATTRSPYYKIVLNGTFCKWR